MTPRSGCSGGDLPYVSRGGLKLAAALDHWQIAVTGRACLDVGASTGGFTDCLLQHGAAHVTAIDTGFGQIHMKLRNDPRVSLLERTNARLLEPWIIGGTRPRAKKKRFSSSTSRSSPPRLCCRPCLPLLLTLVEAVILVKPQFEAGREHVGKGGIVRDPEAHQLAIDKVADCVRALGWTVAETIPSPITGAEGNKEFLLYARRS